MFLKIVCFFVKPTRSWFPNSPTSSGMSWEIKANVAIEKNSANVNLLEDQYGIAPGQACVFYLADKIGDKVLGGGWIVND